MKKRKVSVFVTCFLFLVMCSSFVSAIANPLVEVGKEICIEEHEHNEDCDISTNSKEDGKDNVANETEDIVNKDENANDNEDKKPETDVGNEQDKNEGSEENEGSGSTEGNKGEEGLEEENKNESEEAPKDENKEELDKEESEKEETSKENEENLADEKKPEEREYKNPTTDTFEKVVGDYSLNTILNKYNVFSRDTVTGSHIVGPIVGAKAYSIQEDKGSFKVSDYSNKIPSFIGELYRIQKGPAAGTVAQVALNYGFETQAPPGVDLSVKPNLYVNETGNQIKVVGGEGNYSYQFIDDGQTPVTGPNNWGNSPILQNDNFIDFNKAFEAINKESEAFAKNRNNIVVDGETSEYKIDGTGYLKLDVGKSYVIKDASRLLTVDFIHPEGYDPLTNPYPEPTIINIIDENLATSVLEEKRQNRFPDIYVNGVLFVGTKTGTPGFGDGQIGKMNRIIWNIPYVKTVGEEERIVRSQLGGILGHIVAPNAEFWSYIIEDGKFKWIGGNMNGAAIVKSWHGGTIESHYWPYDEEIIPPKENKVAMSVNAKKIFNKGSLDNQKFKFTLEYDGESLPEGVVAENIPQTVQQKPDGTIEFLPITFIKEGIYNFKIKEVKGDDPDIIYDDSVYILKVTVYEENGELKYKNEITKVSGTNSEGVNDIVFVNEKKLKFTIEKKDKLTGNLLEGAIFDLYEADENGNPKGEPIIKDIATDSTGKITVSNKILEYNKHYVLVETKAPENYMTGGNIIFYIKGDSGPYPDGEGVVVIENGGILEVLNTKSDEILPETGGIGTDKFIFVGLGLMLSSLILLKIKLIKR